MPVSVYIDDEWKKIHSFVNVTDNWKPLINIWVNKDGTWKKTYTYSWICSNWGSCSKNCGGGTQTRTVECYRNDGIKVADNFCLNFSETTTQGC